MNHDELVIVAIVGTKYQGKDTYANMLKSYLEKSGLSCDTVALADPMKAGLRAAFPSIPAEYFSDPALKAEPVALLGGKTVREAMQKFGTEYAQGLFGKQIWLNVFDEWLKGEASLDALPDVLIVTDVRFTPELDHFRHLGARITFVHRDFGGSKGSHSSEAGLYHEYENEFDVWINNAGNLYQLQSQAFDEAETISKNIANNYPEVFTVISY